MSVSLHLYLRVADSPFLALDFSLLNGCVADGSLWVWSWVTADKGWFSQQLGGSLAGFPHPLAPVVFSVKTCALQLCSETHFKGPWLLPHLRQGLGVRSKEGERSTRRWIAQAEPPPPVAVAWRPGEGAAPILGADPSQEREPLHAGGSPRPMNDGGTPGSAPRLGAAADLPWMNLSPGFPLGCPAVAE